MVLSSDPGEPGIFEAFGDDLIVEAVLDFCCPAILDLLDEAVEVDLAVDSVVGVVERVVDDMADVLVGVLCVVLLVVEAVVVDAFWETTVVVVFVDDKVLSIVVVVVNFVLDSADAGVDLTGVATAAAVVLENVVLDVVLEVGVLLIVVDADVLLV